MTCTGSGSEKFSTRSAGCGNVYAAARLNRGSMSTCRTSS
jgi:hypothetical protein